jgi:serine/threonine protein kinase
MDSTSSNLVVLKDRYELHQLINQGGMGRVYHGFDRVLHREVAIKILKNVDSSEMILRFEREAQTLSQLNHPNLAAIYDYGIEGTEPFMVIELIEGKSLDHFIAQSGGIDVERGLNWIEQIGEGLAAAHDRGVIHRDIKPGNILVSSRGEKERMIIVDFGLAITDSQNKENVRLTSSTIVLGTQRYMPPEQMEGQVATPATDIYAYGLVCAEILGGPLSISAGRLRSSFEAKEAIKSYWPILESACHVDPDKRWLHVRAMLRAFHDISKGEPISKVLQASQKDTRRSIPLRTVLITLFIIVCVGIFGWKMSSSKTAVPVVAIENAILRWNSPNTLEINIVGTVQKSLSHRMILEVAVCDPRGNRVPSSSESVLVDHALGALQALDIIQSPQVFQKVFRISIPESIPRGYISITIFDANNLIIAQQSSAFWPER